MSTIIIFNSEFPLDLKLKCTHILKDFVLGDLGSNMKFNEKLKRIYETIVEIIEYCFFLLTFK